MKKVLVMVALVMASVIVYAFNDSRETNQGKKEVTGNGEVVVMDKDMFLKDVFDYEKSKEWNYKGNKPAIIDLYADWCGPCRQTAPIMKELAKEYAGKIVIYKVNVDKQKELAALFNATSIPLFVFIPMKGDPQLFRGAADKATYKKAIDEFLLKYVFQAVFFRVYNTFDACLDDEFGTFYARRCGDVHGCSVTAVVASCYFGDSIRFGV